MKRASMSRWFPSRAALGLVLALGCRSPAEPFEGQYRAEAIRRYEALLGDSSPALSARHDEIRFRLALLYLEEAQAAAGPAAGAFAAPNAYERSLRLLDEVIARRDSPFREDALYYRAVALQELGRSEESVAAFRSLLREFPFSARAAEIWFRLANDAVQKNRLQEALGAYEEVLRRGDPNYRDQAAYMLAWTAFSLRQEARARVTLMDLLARLEAGGQRTASLYPQAVELLAKVIRSEGDPSPLSGPWVGARPAYAGLALRRVAELFRETSAFAQAAAAYEGYLRQFPEDPEAEAIEKRVVECWEKAGDPERAEAARDRLIARHLEEGQLRDASMAPVLKDSALYLHRKARETGRLDLYARAVERYRIYGQGLPPGPEKAEAFFFLAEASKEMANLRDAADAYSVVAELRDPARGEEAAFRRVALFEEMKDKGQATVDDVLRAYLDYFRWFPGGKRDPELRLRYAAYLFDQKRFADAALTASPVASASSDSTLRQRAGLLAARAAFAAGDYPQAARWAQGLLTEPSLPAPTRSEAEQLHAASLYKEAESLADRPREAAARYELLAARYPNHDSAPAALYNAAVSLRRAGEKARALSLLRQLIDRYPRADLSRDATIAATELHRELGDPEGAASLLERAAEGDPAQSETYLYQAALEAERAAAHGRTIEVCRKFLRVRRADDLRAARVRLAMARAYRELGREDEAERAALETLGKLPAGGDPGESRALQEIAAESQALLAEVALRRFEAVRIVEPVAATLARKKQAMERALERLGQAAGYGLADVSLASWYKIGYVQAAFADAVMEAPRPKNLSPEERARYDALLEEQVRPYREAAARAFRTALERAAGSGIENEWTARARSALGRLEPRGPTAAGPAPDSGQVPILPGS